VISEVAARRVWRSVTESDEKHARRDSTMSFFRAPEAFVAADDCLSGLRGAGRSDRLSRVETAKKQDLKIAEKMVAVNG
jgi:hypothetical protein